MNQVLKTFRHTRKALRRLAMVSWWGVTYSLALFARRQSGSILVETAFAIPILLIVFMGTLEASRFILLEQKVARIAANLADLTARSADLTEADIAQVFEAAAFVVEPFDLGDQGTVLLSNVGRRRGELVTWVNWQRTGPGTGGATSSVGAEGGKATLPVTMSLIGGEDVIVAEVFFDYRPLIFSGVLPPQTLYRTAFARPRFGALTQIN